MDVLQRDTAGKGLLDWEPIALSEQQGGKNMAVIDCLDCGYEIPLGAGPWLGQLIRCHNCGAELEIINVDPLELDWAYLEPAELEEDWDWDWYEDENWEEEEVNP
jgi:alpha-aminoadipate carrier protein LysW